MPDSSQCEQIFQLTIHQVTQSFGISEQTVIEIIEQGIVEPQGEQPENWVFQQQQINVIAKVLKFQRDLGVNFAGAALALELLDEIERLKSQLK